MTIDEFITNRHVQGTLLERLRALSSADAQSVSRCIAALNPSANFVREMLQIADEICSRDKVTLVELLSGAELVATISADKGSIKQRQAAFRKQLEAIRFPVRSELLGKLRRCEQAIVKKTGLRVSFPQDLEGDVLSVEVVSKTPEQFAAIARKFEQLSDDPDVSRMFALLRGESELI